MPYNNVTSLPVIPFLACTPIQDWANYLLPLFHMYHSFRLMLLETVLFSRRRLPQALLPLLRKSAHSRIVHVSSGAGSYVGATFRHHKYQQRRRYDLRSGKNCVQCAQGQGFPHQLNVSGFTGMFDGGEARVAHPVSDGAATIFVLGVGLAS
jgi:hypothetical protein